MFKTEQSPLLTGKGHAGELPFDAASLPRMGIWPYPANSEPAFSLQVCFSGQRSSGSLYILLTGQGTEAELLSREEKDMHRGYQYLFSFLVLSAALAAPSAISATTQPQDNGRQEEGRRDE